MLLPAGSAKGASCSSGSWLVVLPASSLTSPAPPPPPAPPPFASLPLDLLLILLRLISIHLHDSSDRTTNTFPELLILSPNSDLDACWGIYFLCIRGSAHVSVCTPTPRVGLISGLSLPFRGSRLCRGQKARLKPHTWADRHRAMQILDKGGGVANPQPERGPQPHTGSQMRPRPFLGLTILGLRDSDLAKHR